MVPLLHAAARRAAGKRRLRLEITVGRALIRDPRLDWPLFDSALKRALYGEMPIALGYFPVKK
jgi:hypothetical protein